MTALSFKGKEFVYNHHLAVPFRPLVPHPDKGIGPASLDGKLIIQGDNLHALKALLPYYAGKVDCIFIDPPYNTGNQGWSYNDNVNAPMIREWLNNNPIGSRTGKPSILGQIHRRPSHRPVGRYSFILRLSKKSGCGSSVNQQSACP